MKIYQLQRLTIATCLVIKIITFSSCLTSKKMDSYISGQYDNEIPKVNKKKQVEDITFSSTLPATSTNISNTQPHTKVLPLLLYWNIDMRQTSTLNSGIATSGFTNAVNAMANKGLNAKLAGRKLELTIEQAPATFALIDKTHAIWLLVYAIHWEKVYIQPEAKDLVVSYKCYEDDHTIKTGKITVKNSMNDKGLRFFQSWKSAVAEELVDYGTNVTTMSNQFVNQLMEQL